MTIKNNSGAAKHTIGEKKRPVTSEAGEKAPLNESIERIAHPQTQTQQRELLDGS